MAVVFDTKSNYVFTYLKEKITNGEYEQGESIVISRVAEELGVSTIPVREALKRLESEGLVEIIPHKGALVVSFSEEEINNLMQIRTVLEGYATGLAAKNVDDKYIAKLEKINEKMKKAADEKDDEKFTDLNKEFHSLLYAGAQNSMLYNMILELWDGGNWSKSIFAFYPEKMEESVVEHKTIIEALKNGDDELAEREARDHKMKNIGYYTQLSSK